MIILTRLNGPAFALNPDLIERAEQTPDTVITLVDGKHYVIAETLDQLIATIQRERAAVLALAGLSAQVEEPAPLIPLRRDSDVIPLRRNT